MVSDKDITLVRSMGNHDRPIWDGVNVSQKCRSSLIDRFETRTQQEFFQLSFYLGKGVFISEYNDIRCLWPYFNAKQVDCKYPVSYASFLR